MFTRGQKYYTLKEASELLNITYRAVRYYTKIYTNDVFKDVRKVYVNDNFIKKVKKNRVVNENRISEPRNKKQLLQEIEELKNVLDQYQVNENERIEVFTDEEYKIFQERLIEWRLQRKELDLKDEHFEKELKGKDELIEHYKSQYDYQRKQSDKQLEQMQKLLELFAERNRIEAVEKKVIDKNI